MLGFGLGEWEFLAKRWAVFTASNPLTKPFPVAQSNPGLAECPPVAELLFPAITSRAVCCKISFACWGDNCGLTCFIKAQIPAIWGAAADVPLKAAQPSSDEVSSASGCLTPGKPKRASKVLPGGTGKTI